jgi:hypothetical protein
MSRYVQLYRPDHPRASASGCVSEHILVAEQALGRLLPIGAVVHHHDRNPRNNANRNLVICQDSAYHALLHLRMRVLAAGGDPNTQRVCGTCKRVLPFAAFRFLNLRSERPRLMSECLECEPNRRPHRINRRVVFAKSRVNVFAGGAVATDPTRARGAAHGRARLNADIVRAIRQMRADEPAATLRQIAARFGVGPGTVHCVLVGRTWRHVRN